MVKNWVDYLQGVLDEGFVSTTDLALKVWTGCGRAWWGGAWRGRGPGVGVVGWTEGRAQEERGAVDGALPMGRQAWGRGRGAADGRGGTRTDACRPTNPTDQPQEVVGDMEMSLGELQYACALVGWPRLGRLGWAVGQGGDGSIFVCIPYWSSKLIARTSRDPLATRAPAERDLVNARPRLSNSSYQFKTICRPSCSAAPRASLRQRSWSWARVRMR
jgi:hypothetical protein